MTAFATDTYVPSRPVNRQHQRFIEMAVEARREDVAAFAVAMTAAVQAALDTHMPRPTVVDLAAGALDAISDLVGVMRRDLDDANLDPDSAEVDVTELLDLLNSAKGGR